METLVTTPDMIFRVTNYLDLHNVISFAIEICSYQIKLSMFYYAQTTNLTFVGQHMRCTVQ